MLSRSEGRSFFSRAFFHPDKGVPVVQAVQVEGCFPGVVEMGLRGIHYRRVEQRLATVHHVRKRTRTESEKVSACAQAVVSGISSWRKRCKASSARLLYSMERGSIPFWFPRPWQAARARRGRSICRVFIRGALCKSMESPGDVRKILSGVLLCGRGRCGGFAVRKKKRPSRSRGEGRK